jgi:fructose/tagatose bisphosphate aldolase
MQKGRGKVSKLERAQAEALDREVVEIALLTPDERTQAARSLRDLCLRQGLALASIGPHYRAIASGKAPVVTAPAINLRGLTYDLARAAWRAALKLNAAPVIFELAPSEAATGDQPFMEYVAMVLAAAVREGYRGPVFFQGDHLHVEDGALSEVQALCLQALRAGMRQIDIDAADVVVEGAQGRERHRANAELTAAMTLFIRQHEPEGADVVVGGEVGVIGGQNTTPQDVQAFMEAYQKALPRGMTGLGKLSVQTGTRHGGVVRADGSTGTMPLDVALVRELSDTVRQQYGLPGVVQHGASTLSPEQFSQLPRAGAIEVHLATAIQNMVFDHPALPAALREEMIDVLVGEEVGYAEKGAEDEDAEALSRAQRFYHNRWRAWGRFKPELWTLPQEVRDEIAGTCEAWFEELFQALQIAGNGEALQALYGRSKES